MRRCALDWRTGLLARASSELTIDVDRHGFGFWRPHALVSQAVLAGSGAAPGDPVLFGRALGEVGMDRFDLIYPSLTGVVALGLKAAGAPELGRKLVNQALGRPGAMDRCFAPEMLLCSGLLATANDLAHGVLLRSLEHARAQAAPLLELRAATALAQLEVGSGPDRGGMLRAALNRVEGGAGTLHVEAAKGVLGRVELGSAVRFLTATRRPGASVAPRVAGGGAKRHSRYRGSRSASLGIGLGLIKVRGALQPVWTVGLH